MTANRDLLAQRANWLVAALSAIACSVAVWVRLPGMVLAGLTPDWPLIWVVCWSVNRPAWQSAVAGVVMGFIQDSLTHGRPTHALGLGLVAVLTSRLNKQRFIREDFISVALIVFGMAIASETVMAVQWSLFLGWDEATGHWVGASLDSIWTNYQQVTLQSAIISSLWAPAVYLPLNLWWRQFDEQPQETQE